MYLASIPNRGAKPTILLRESFREGGKVKSRTLANLSKVPPHALEALRAALAGKVAGAACSGEFEIVRSVHHGHAEAVIKAIRKLGLDRMISNRRCPERDRVLGMIAARLLSPGSKLKTTRSLKATSLPETLGIEGATEDELYKAMDWLLERQPAIEKKLAKKHLAPCGLVLYDLSSTWVEGECCPLAARGYSRDRKSGKLQVNFGLLTDEEGRPVSVSVYSGRTADPSTVQDQVKKLKDEFGIDLVVFVGDRGMVTQTQIDKFIEQGGVEWISALKSGAIRRLRAEGTLQLGLFDEKNLFELSSKEFPGERLVACKNEDLAKRRAKKRQSMVDATKKELDQIQKRVMAGRLNGKSEIGLCVGRVINKYKMAKHFKLEIDTARFHYRVRQDRVDAEAALDGIYVIRTSVPTEVFSAEDTVRHYKKLTRVEKSFRSMKTVDLLVRPIFHYSEPRVRAHIFLCMLAYYVEWHLRQSWASLLFANEVDTSATRDPVARATPSADTRKKAETKVNAENLPLHSFASLLEHLSSVVRNYCRYPGTTANEIFVVTTTPNAVQARALDLLDAL
jgi:transposase